MSLHNTYRDLLINISSKIIVFGNLKIRPKNRRSGFRRKKIYEVG